MTKLANEIVEIINSRNEYMEKQAGLGSFLARGAKKYKDLFGTKIVERERNLFGIYGGPKDVIKIPMRETFSDRYVAPIFARNRTYMESAPESLKNVYKKLRRVVNGKHDLLDAKIKRYAKAEHNAIVEEPSRYTRDLFAIDKRNGSSAELEQLRKDRMSKIKNWGDKKNQAMEELRDFYFDRGYYFEKPTSDFIPRP